MASSASSNGYGGTLVVRGKRPSGKRVIVSGSVTAENIALELARLSSNGQATAGRVDRLKELQEALIQFTHAQYGRQATPEIRTLDQLLTAGRELARRLKVENSWRMKKIALVTGKVTDLRDRVWGR
jgi:hypothetical protein